MNIDFPCRIRLGERIDDHAAGGIDDIDIGIHEGAQRPDLFLHRVERYLRVVEIRRVGISDQRGFPIELVRGVAPTVLLRHAGNERRHHNEAENRKYQIPEKNLQIKCLVHKRIRRLPDYSITSNLYPTDQIVAIRQWV